MDNATADAILNTMARLRKVQALAIDPSTTPGERDNAKRMAEKLQQKLAANTQREPEYLRKKYASQRHYIKREERIRRVKVELRDVDYAMNRLGKVLSRVADSTVVSIARQLNVHPDLLRGAVEAYRKKEDWSKPPPPPPNTVKTSE
jgi:Protein of unknown function (DUF2786)